jgi:hypothetical protein
MARLCSECEEELRQVETNFLETGQVWQTGFAPVALEGWACPRCGQVRFYAADVEALFSQQEVEDVPVTLKEAYGEVLPAALEWSDTVQLCAVYSSGDDEDAYVDVDGLCPYWSFTFRNPAGEYLDLVLAGRIVERSLYEFEGTAGEPFTLEDIHDSPEIVARARDAGLPGEAFSVVLERDTDNTLRAVVVNADGDEQLQVDPRL